MTRAFVGWILIIFCVFIPYKRVAAQDFSNKGTDFWITYPAHIDGTLSAMGLYITSDVAATGTITVASQTLTFSVAPNSVARKFLGPNGNGDASNLGVYLNQDDAIALGKAIHVVSDNPVAVYAHIIKSARSGASLILPSTVWGRQYIVPSYKNVGVSSNGYGYGIITVVAAESNTVVQITPTVASKNGARVAKTPYQITLSNPGDVYQVQFQQNADISGTIVESVSSGTGGCKKIGVFSSTTWSAFGCNNASSGDNLYQQLFPTGAWGKNFITAPFINRPFDIVRIFVQDTTTVVTISENGATSTLTQLINGAYYEHTTSNPLYIKANKPISVVQYMVTEKCDSRNSGFCGGNNPCPYPGDPEMVLINPLEQTINNITVFSAHQNWVPPKQSNVVNCYLNIILNSNSANSFKINGNPPNGSFTQITGTNFSYLQEDVTSLASNNPVHNLTADSGFIAIAYGYGEVESYGYNAGTNVKDFDQFLTVQNPYPSPTFNNNTTCLATPFHLGVVLPFKPASMVWDFGNNPILTPNTVFTNNTPLPDSTFTTDGVDHYYYKLPSIYSISSLGSLPVKITVNNLTSDGCSGIQDLNFNVQIIRAPTSDFTIVSDGCFPDSVKFIDNSTAYTSQLIGWIWDFGNGLKQQIKNPSVLYTSANTYTTKLRAINTIGCYADTSKTVALSGKPIANFSQSAIACTKNTVSFTDQSTISGGTLVKWYWNVGKPVVQTSSGTVSNTYTIAGVDSVSIMVESNTGCRDSTIKQVKVYQSPIAGFIAPNICLDDAFAQFVNASSIEDTILNKLNYSWNFGDALLNPSTNTSSNKDPIHKYSNIGYYYVSLTTTSNNGCFDTLTQLFTVNGTKPLANYSIVNKGNLCSNEAIKLMNTSTVDFGNITRIEIYWDFLNNPSNKQIDSNPSFQKIYTQQYPEFHSPLYKQYRVKYFAYSGITCVSIKDTVLTIFASPNISVNIYPKTAICLGDGIEFFGILNNNAVSIGKWKWNLGDNTESNDQHTYKTYASTGKYTVQIFAYTQEGCLNYPLDTIITVYDYPKISIPHKWYVLEGNSVDIKGSYSKDGTIFKWNPSTYLNSDTLPNPICKPINDIRYTLTVSNEAQCVTSDTVFVKVLLQPLIPNAFSPNGDLDHDTWHIGNLSAYPDCRIMVFNRYGQRVYYSVGYSKDWDGTFNGSPLPVGTYYYIIEPKNGRSALSGSVTILR